MLAAIYARKSTEQTGVADDQKSVARQVDHARAYAERKGWTVADEHVYVDDGISGAEFTNRPGFLRLMNALKPRPPFDVLIMSEESRLGREQIETAYALKQLVTAGVRVFFYLEDRERTLDSPTDKIMLSLTAFADELEREKARQRVTDAMVRKAKAGHVTGGRVFGYDNVRLASGGVMRRVNEAEAAVVRRIFQLYAEGFGQKPIAKRLNAEGAPCPRSQRARPAAWCPSSVREILYRPLYRGEVVYNRTRKRNAWGQLEPRDRPESEWLRRAVPELRIVSEELWNAAHARLDYQRSVYLRGTHGALWGRPRDGGESKYLLPGFARCGICNAGLYVRSRSHGKRRAYFYGCTSFHLRGRTVCANNTEQPMELIDRTVLTAIVEDLLSPTRVERIVRETVAALRPTLADVATRRPQLDAAVRTVEREIEHVTAAIASGGHSPALLADLKRREARRAGLLDELADVGRVQEVCRLDTRLLDGQIRKRLNHWQTLLMDNVPHGRQILRKLLVGPVVFTPMKGDPQAWEFRATGALDQVLAGIVDTNSVASPTGFEPVLRP